ncbi:phytoene desaturase family protein [Enemella sp. A6]|uniref:phytoene desaturase family protein n=1 Tax=Enemella sp. A6 TaxID=3440152 RepID=UPI003EB8044E
MSRPLKTVVVIGAGIAGLATAGLLAREGFRVTVVEGRDSIGGRAGSWQQQGFRFDTGPSWYLMPEVFEHFFRLMGTTADRELDLRRLTPAYRIYPEPPGIGPAQPLDVHSGREVATALFDEVEPGAGERLAGYLDSAAETYELAVQKFLYDSYENAASLRDPALLRRLPKLAPLLSRSLAGLIESRFTDRRLRQILGYPAVFLGGSPYRMPSLYHLMSHLDLDQGVLYPQGGMTTVIEAIARLATAAGARIETDAEVTRILTRDRWVRGVRLADGREVPADLVVSTADLHHTETALLERTQQTYPQRWWNRRTPSPGALLIMLGVRGELPELAHHTLLFTADWRANFEAIFGPSARIPDPASIYVCRPSATDPSVAPPGDENLFTLVPVPADPSIGHGGIDGAGDPRVEAAADRVVAQLATWCGVDDLAERVVVRRTVAPGDFSSELNSWQGNALGLAHTLRQSAMFRPRGASRKVGGLLYAGASTLPGIGMPMCLISAELVLKRLRGDRTPGPLPEPAEGGT